MSAGASPATSLALDVADVVLVLVGATVVVAGASPDADQLYSIAIAALEMARSKVTAGRSRRAASS